MKNPEFPVSVFYDGACSVCTAQIGRYQRQDRHGRLIPVDISAPDFDPEPYRIPVADFRYELHVIDRSGCVYRGVEAFWAIWQAFPASTLYGLLGGLITMPVVNPLARLLYKGFARLRPYLPKPDGCDSGTCRIGTRH